MGMIVVTEELSRGSLGAAGSLITRPEILARALLKGGTEEQKQKWLPQLAVGDPLCAVAVTEPNYGSDVANMRLKATKTEGGWLLNGAKTWCTFGGKAGVLLVLARTNPDLSLGHRGLSMFLAEKPRYDGHAFEYKQEGGGNLSAKAIATIGYRGMHSFELFFDDFFVPDENLLGGPRRARARASTSPWPASPAAASRPPPAPSASCRPRSRRAVSYAKDREVFGKPIADYQLTQVKLARMATLSGGLPAVHLRGRTADGSGQGRYGSQHGEALHLQDRRMGDARGVADPRRHGLRRRDPGQPLLRRCPGAVDLRRRRGDAGAEGHRAVPWPKSAKDKQALERISDGHVSGFHSAAGTGRERCPCVAGAGARTRTTAAISMSSYRGRCSSTRAASRFDRAADAGFRPHLHADQSRCTSTPSSPGRYGFTDLPASPQMVFNVVLSLGVQNDSEKAIANLGYYDAQFLRPVYPGDTMRALHQGDRPQGTRRRQARHRR